MATIKGFTNIPQSKALRKLLPLESADMYYPNRIDIKYQGVLPIEYKFGNPLISQEIAAWSLAALLGVLPSATLDSSNDHYYRLHYMEMFTHWYDNPVDACVAMIKRLHKLNLL